VPWTIQDKMRLKVDMHRPITQLRTSGHRS
jgi:hypothetical protein